MSRYEDLPEDTRIAKHPMTKRQAREFAYHGRNVIYKNRVYWLGWVVEGKYHILIQLENR
jgi:hypothetical protein